MSLYDYSQDREIERLKDAFDAENSSVDQSLQRLWSELHLERRRNDVQTGRIKVLAQTLEAVLKGIAASSPMTPDDATTLLQRVGDAMKPVNLKDPPKPPPSE